MCIRDRLKIAQWFWRRFLNFVNVFLLFHNYMYLPLKKDVAHHLNKLDSPSSKDALCQVWLKIAQWFWRRFLNFVNVFLLFHNYMYLPLEKDVALHLNKLDSPSPQGSFVSSLVEIGTVVLKKKLSMYFSYFILNSPWKRVWPFIWTNLNPLHPRCFNVPSLVETSTAVLEKKMKMWKVYNNDGQQTNCDQKSSIKPSAQVS